MLVCILRYVFSSFLDTAMSTCRVLHMSIGQRGLLGSAAQFPAVEEFSHGDEHARMETNALDAALYVTFMLLLSFFLKQLPREMESVSLMLIYRLDQYNIARTNVVS